MDTTLMPWVAGLFILLVAAAILFVTRALRNRNSPARDSTATKSGKDAELKDQ